MPRRQQTLPRREIKTGNAALLYHLMFSQWDDNADRDNAVKKLLGNLDSEENVQLARELVNQWKHSPEYKILTLAVKRNKCDWELPVDELGMEVFPPGLGKIKQATRNLALQAETEILDGKLNSAIETISQAMTLSVHAASSDMLISHLVAIDCQNLLFDSIVKLINAPDSPNLFWPMFALPQTRLDPAQTLKNERAILLAADYMNDPLNFQMTPEQWREEYNKWLWWTEATRSHEISSNMKATLDTAKYHALARAYFIDRGMSAQQTDKYPIWQLIIAHNVEVYNFCMDETEKRFSVPYHQSLKMRDIEAEIVNQNQSHGQIPARMLVPDMLTFRKLAVCREARFAALACVEAVRAYAADHGGWMPESLEIIKQTPAPENPFTGKEFDWQLQQDGSATLEYEECDGKVVRFVVIMARKN